MKLHPFSIVKSFEDELARFFGAKYAVALDTGTDAFFLTCQYLKVKEVSIPKRTFVSVPASVIHAGGRIRFDDREWKGVYTLDPYPIVDSACRFRPGYEPGTFVCLSFQYRKHLPIGRGGAILHDNDDADRWFKLARFSGRHEGAPTLEDVPELIGWQMYMEPERAARGLTYMMYTPPEGYPDLSYKYPDLSTYPMWDEYLVGGVK